MAMRASLVDHNSVQGFIAHTSAELRVCADVGTLSGEYNDLLFSSIGSKSNHMLESL